MARFILRVASALVATATGALALRRAWMIVAAMLPRRPRAPAAPAPPSATLIVPAFDEEQALPGTLAALERLDYPAGLLTVILVDDGSSDRSGQLMSAWASGRDRTSALSLGGRTGKGDAINHAISAGPRTELVVVCDADIRPRPAMLRILAGLFGDPSVGAAAAYVAPANPDDGIVASYGALEAWVHQLIACSAWDRLGLGPASNGCVAYRSEALSETGGFDSAGPGEDVRIASALSARGWRARFEDEAVADSDVVSTLSAYLHQHVRWARNLLTASGVRSTRERDHQWGPAEHLRDLERRVASAGYVDRVVIAAAFALAAAGRLPRSLPGAYVATLAADVASALVKEGRPGEIPRYLGVAALFSLVDVVASAAAIAVHAGAPAQRWPGLTRTATDPAARRSRRPRRPSRRGRSGQGAGRALG